MVDLLLSPVFHKFPGLKVALSEGGIGWMPWMLERIDYTWERHRHYTGINQDVRPSDLFQEHIFGCFIADEAGIEMRAPHRRRQHHVRVRLPALRQQLAAQPDVLEKVLADVPDGEARKIAEDNARRVFNFPRTAATA